MEGHAEEKRDRRANRRTLVGSVPKKRNERPGCRIKRRVLIGSAKEREGSQGKDKRPNRVALVGSARKERKGEDEARGQVE